MGRKERIEVLEEIGKYENDGINKFKEATRYINEESFAKADLRLSDAIDSFRKAANKTDEWARVKGISSVRGDIVGEWPRDLYNTLADLTEKLQNALKKYEE